VGGRTWWAHFEFTRINIDEPIILKNKIEDLREAAESMFDRRLNIPRSGRLLGDAQERS